MYTSMPIPSLSALVEKPEVNVVLSIYSPACPIEVEIEFDMEDDTSIEVSVITPTPVKNFVPKFISF